MAAGAPWSVKGIDPRAREVAKELARRSGMTLGEWLNRIILEDDLPDEVASPAEFPLQALRPTPGSPLVPDDRGRIAAALGRLAERIEAAETRTELSIQGVEHSVRQALARVEAAEREQHGIAARVGAAGEHLESAQASLAERLAWLEAQASGPRAPEALHALDGLAGGPGSSDLVLLGERVAAVERRTTEALDSLRGAFGDLDLRLRRAEEAGGRDLDQRLETLADQLAARVEAAREDMAHRLTASGSPDLADARIDRLAAEMGALEQRSQQAIRQLGREVLTLAEGLGRRVQRHEQSAAQSLLKVGEEMARVAGSVEGRLGRMDQVHAQALERLGGEIGRVAAGVDARLIQSEQRAATAFQDVGEQIILVSERIEARYDRIANDLSERIRESEARTARVVEEARISLEARLLGGGRAAPAAASARAELALDGDNFQTAEGFAPIPESGDAEDLFEPPSPAEPPERELSTSEVIEQARAAARTARPPPTEPAPDRPVRPSVFQRLNVGRPMATWHTALMVAGGAAFLSVGAAGVVLAGSKTQTDELAAAPHVPRIGIAMANPARGAAAGGEPATQGAGELTRMVRAVEHREPGALEQVQGAAEAGRVSAQLYLASLYEDGAKGLRRDLAEARRWTAKAAASGDARAQHNLALFYFRGEGGERDLGEAAAWFRKAAAQGLIDSQYNLGLLHQTGSAAPRDLAQAYGWFALAAKAGDAPSRAAAAELKPLLTPAQIEAAERWAAAFGAGTAPSRTAPPPLLDGAQMQSAQRILGKLGYYAGQADGTTSSDFAKAVAAYQRDQGLAATGALDPATATKLAAFTR